MEQLYQLCLIIVIRARERIGCQATRSQESMSQAQDEEGDKKSNS